MTVMSQLMKSTNADLPNIVFGPKMSCRCMVRRSSRHVSWQMNRVPQDVVAALSNIDYLCISRDTCRTNHDHVF